MKLPDDLDALLGQEGARRGVAVSELTRKAIRHGLVASKGRRIASTKSRTRVRACRGRAPRPRTRRHGLMLAGRGARTSAATSIRTTSPV